MTAHIILDTFVATQPCHILTISGARVTETFHRCPIRLCTIIFLSGGGLPKNRIRVLVLVVSKNDRLRNLQLNNTASDPEAYALAGDGMVVCRYRGFQLRFKSRRRDWSTHGTERVQSLLNVKPVDFEKQAFDHFVDTWLIIRECVIFDTQNKFYLRCCHVPVHSEVVNRTQQSHKHCISPRSIDCSPRIARRWSGQLFETI